MTTVYLCEKPSQGQDIARVLGATRKGNGCRSTSSEDVVVTWCFGHLLEMAPPEAYDPALKSWALDTLPIIPEQWRLVVKPSAQRQFTIIKKWLGRASRLVIATDADREGEVIAREVMALCGYRGPVQRLWLSALNDASIRKALSQLRDGVETQPLYLAGMARARADWLVGMNLTRAYSVLGRNAGYQGVLSVGRVQTPTLRLVVDRDRAIEEFTPSPYWTITSTLVPQGVAAPAFRAHWQPPVEHCDSQGRCINETVARTVAQQCSVTGAQAQVTDSKKERKAAPPPLPFDLNSLQQEAGKRFDLSGDQVLEAAQALYETHKITSYPRTECRHLPTSMHHEAPDVLRAVLAMEPELASIRPSLNLNRQTKAWSDKEVEKASHHGIIPTVASVDLTRLSTTERQVYGLIRRQYLIQFLPDHQYDATTLTLSVQGHPFLAKGKATVEPGWTRLFPSSKSKPQDGDDQQDCSSDNATVPALPEGTSCAIQSVDCDRKMTTPPARYTDGTLIAAMKNIAKMVTDPKLRAVLRDTAGLGTGATRANIIATLKKRGFIDKKRGHLVSTEQGRQLIDALPSAITNPDTTAAWEQALEDIATGEAAMDDFMRRQLDWLNTVVTYAKGQTLSALAATVKNNALPCQCGGSANETAKSWRCTSCGNTVWKTTFGKKLTVNQAAGLLVGKTVALKGLVSKKRGRSTMRRLP
ncbi:DNA topoisomerase III [Alloalcanivorax xenomutans]|uniref:DNA topoisomerase III n=1 Tax=Alloalcanivorax xenomutans TaxID=1094342 RepID=UPI001ABFA2CB|nr:DNA topoisomerase III [Alloalcanivorax xenomutans]